MYLYVDAFLNNKLYQQWHQPKMEFLGLMWDQELDQYSVQLKKNNEIIKGLEKKIPNMQQWMPLLWM